MSHPVAQRACLFPIACCDQDRFSPGSQGEHKLPEGSAFVYFCIACRLIEQEQRWIG